MLAHGPLDRVAEIKVAERTVWKATAGLGDPGPSPAETRLIDTVSGMAAVAGTPEDGEASITFAGRVSGVTAGQVLDLTLADDSEVSVTLNSVAYDANNDVTTWLVTPFDLAFSAQTVAVRGAARAGVGEGAGQSGDGTGGRIVIDAPEVFGGDGREGGIAGDMDIDMGAPDQVPNDYLVDVLTAEDPDRAVPAYRGVASAIFRQGYVGNNPYIKPWAFRVTRVLKAEDGSEQWYPEKAPIFVEQPVAADDEGDFFSGIVTNSPKVWKRKFLSPFGFAGFNIAEYSDPDFDDSDWDVAGLPVGITRPPGEEFAELPLPQSLKTTTGAEWFRTTIPATDDPVTVGFARAEAAVAVWIDGNELDIGWRANGPEKVKLVTLPASDQPRQIAVLFNFGTRLGLVSATSVYGHVWFDVARELVEPDMNPAHIIRELLTNRDWGLGASEGEIGESFRTAADTLFEERFGLSLQWERQSSVEQFIAEILRHIDATIYVDRRTGLIELKLIRDDYDIADLPVFDEDDVVDWSGLARRDVAALIDTVIVEYTDRRTDKRGAVSVTDIARRQFGGGGRSPSTQEFMGVRWESLASRLAARELRSQSAQLVSGPVVVNRRADALNPGDPIRLTSPTYGIDGVFRVVELDLGDGRTNAITLKVVEDVFALGTLAPVGGAIPGPRPLGDTPRPLDRRLVMEAPYWAVVRALGHDAAEAQLAGDPDAGAIMAAAPRPAQSALETEIWTRPAANFAEDGNTGFAPFARLAGALSADPEATTASVSDWIDRDAAPVGAILAIGSELMRLDGVADGQISVGRGVLDTVPQRHAAGSEVAIWGVDYGLARSELSLGDAVPVRLRPRTPRGLLPLDRAPEDVVTMASRAIRPLPPGNLRADGVFQPPAEALIANPVALTWAHRDRLAQTASALDDYLAGNIGPETGVEYDLMVYWLDTAGAVIEPAALVTDLGQATSHTVAMADIPTGSAPSGTTAALVTVRARRDVGGVTYRDWQFRGFVFQLGASSGDGRGYGAAWGVRWGD
ncbi:MAG: hypothetical protein Tsb0020_48180 [Haliangiales bacterium]